LLPALPSGHRAWAFDGIVRFEVGATRFLASAPAHEQLMFVVDDPVPRRWPQHLLESGRLLIASASELYGPTRRVDAPAQLARLTAVLQSALANGYRGIRVAADSTSAIIATNGSSAWAEWERAAEAFTSVNPVIWMCGFDRSRLPETDLAGVLQLHTNLVDS
jgi:hypothetical protein